MRPVPIIILGGEAGVGKDTIADIIVEQFQGVKLAQADPLKRFAYKFFGLTKEQLWGPSAARNAVADQLVGLNWRFWKMSFDVNAVTDWLFDIQAEVWKDTLLRWIQDTEQQKPITPRAVLQSLGSWGRQVDHDIWIRKALKDAQKLLSGYYTYSPEKGLMAREGVQIPKFVVITDGRYANEIIAIRMVGGVAMKILRPGNELSKQASAAGIPNHSSETEFAKIPEHFFTYTFVNYRSLVELQAEIRGLFSEFYCG